MKKLLGLQLTTGAALVAFGLSLSISGIPRFYAPLSVGTWLLADAAETLRFRTGIVQNLLARQGLRHFARIYVAFVVFALLGDLFAGIYVSGVWEYPSYSSLFHWLILYGIAYPGGGLFTYSFLRAVVGPSRMVSSVVTAPRATLSTASLGILIAVAILSGIIFNITNPWLRIGYIGASFLLWLFLLEVVANQFGTAGPIKIVSSSPSILGPIAMVAFVSALVHELPNIIPFEWSYTNLPLESEVLGIPVVVLIGWITLVVFPWALVNSQFRHGVDPFGSPTHE